MIPNHLSGLRQGGEIHLLESSAARMSLRRSALIATGMSRPFSRREEKGGRRSIPSDSQGLKKTWRGEEGNREMQLSGKARRQLGGIKLKAVMKKKEPTSGGGSEDGEE